MDKKYKIYFNVQDVDKWSLIDYDSWAINNVKFYQPTKGHRTFYKLLTNMLINNVDSKKSKKARNLLKNKKADSKHVNELWKSPEILKNVYEEPNKEPEKENRKNKKIKIHKNFDNKEKALSLKERELDIKEREISLLEREMKLRNNNYIEM